VRTVVLESPYAGREHPSARLVKMDAWLNRSYLRDCMRDSLARGEAPFASHMMYVKVLKDSVETERRLGTRAGFAWGQLATVRVFYLDRGMSPGMVQGLQEALRLRQPIEIRGLGAWRGPRRLEALRALNGWLEGSSQAGDVDWSGF